MIFKVLGGYTSSLEMVKIGAYLLTVGDWEGTKRLLWEIQLGFFRKDKRR